MLKKLAVVFLVLTFTVVGFGKGDLIDYSTYDLAPGAVPGSYQGTDDQWDLLYSWEDMEAQSGDNGMLGICFDGTSLWVSGRGVTTANMIYMFDPASGAMTDSWPTGTTSGWGVRDMCTDGTFIYGGEDGGLRVFDMTAHVMVSTIPFPGGFSFQRANAYDPATDHFYAGNFGATCYEQDRNGVLIRQWSPSPLLAIYGMAWDNDADDGPWLWVHDQTTPVSGCNVHQLDPVTLTYTGFSVTLDVPPAPADMAGGLHYCSGIDPVYTTMLVFNQGVPDAGAAFEMYMDTPPTAPAAPENLEIVGMGPDLIAVLTWTNPSVTVAGDPLTDLIGIKIERDGDLIEDITPAVAGAAMDYFDFLVPASGVYEYTVYGYNADDGLPASGEVFIGEMNIDMVLTPVGLPIVIPAGGGELDFNIAISNNEPNVIPADIWTDITLPSGEVYGPIINLSGFNLPASTTLDRDRLQGIPAGAPSGDYIYNAYVGISPDIYFGEDHFNFSKAADGDGFDYGDWYSWGEAFPGEVVTAPDMPSSFTLSEAYPNPFNPVANIGYSLTERSLVELVVYDVTGREIATLVNGWINAGSYSVTFNAQGLASGVYFYRLNAGEFSSVKKMILMK